MAGGVTLFQVLPSSRVTWIKPSSVPTQTVATRSGEGPIEYTTPKRSVMGWSISLAVMGSSVAGTGGWRRDRSALIFSHVLPRSRERMTN